MFLTVISMELYILLVLVLLSSGVSNGKAMIACTCTCSEQYNGGSSTTISIYGEYCDDHLHFRPDGRTTPKCEEHPLDVCSNGDALLKFREPRDTCACSDPSSPVPVCKCKGPRYEDVRRREPIQCTCLEGLVTTIKPTTHSTHATQAFVSGEEVKTTPQRADGILGIDNPIVHITTSQGFITNSTDTPIQGGLGDFNLAILIALIIVVIILVVIAAIVVRRLWRKRVIQRNLTIRYESSMKGDNYKLEVKSSVKQNEEKRPIYTEYNQQLPSIYTTPKSKDVRREEKATAAEPYEKIDDKHRKPRAPARLPDEYDYVTPSQYVVPYSDVKMDCDDKMTVQNSNSNMNDAEPYIEIEPPC